MKGTGRFDWRILVLVFAGAVAAAPTAQRQPRLPDLEIRQVIVERFAEKEIVNVMVTVERGVVTLRGVVPTLWVKQKAVEYAVRIDGVVSVVSELVIPFGEGDRVDEWIAGEVVARLQRYVFLSIFDEADADVQDGVVTLTGSVTMPYKAGALEDLAAHIPGVQGVKNKIRTLPTSSFDDQIRYAVARQIYGDPMFADYALQVIPPIHIIVERGKVTLTGAVCSTVERQAAEAIARSTFAVLRVTNELRVATDD